MSLDYRYEIKYVLNINQLSECMKWLYGKTTANKIYDNRVVNSIYFDDVNFQSIRHNLAGISQRKKYRVRWYGNHEQENNTPLFEIKYRNGRLGCKEFIRMDSLDNNFTNLNVDQIAELCLSDLHDNNVIFDQYLTPTLNIEYLREYYETYDGIRITIDQNIKFSDLQLHSTLCDNNHISYHKIVMEIKFQPSMKDIVSGLISSLYLTPKRHSKYLVGMAKFGYAVYI